MFKKLLYLYNDGHNPFPSGRGGLGYHLPQYPKVMHGEGGSHRGLEGSDDEDTIHTNEYPDIEEENEDEKIIKDADPTTKEGKTVIIEQLIKEMKEIKIKKVEKIDINEIHETIDNVEALLKKREPKPEPKKEPDTGIYKDINESSINEIKTNFYDMLKDGFKIYDFTDEQKEKLLNYIITQKNADYRIFQKNKPKIAFVNKSVDKQLIEISMKELEIEPEVKQEEQEADILNKDFLEYYKNEYTNHTWDNKGVAYEDYLLENKQDFLKEITETKDIKPFTDASTSKSFYVDEDVTKGPIMAYGRPLYEMSGIDLHNKDTALEIKYNIDLDHIEIQGAKLYGNEYRLPYYTKVNDEWKLYNIWMNEFNHGRGGWEYSKSNKKFNILGFINSGQYLYNFTNNFNDFPCIESEKKGKKGETLYTIIKEEMISGNYLSLSSRYDKKEQWYKIEKGKNGMKRT